MKKLRFLLTTTLAVAFLAFTLAACSSKSDNHDEDDDEETEKVEKDKDRDRDRDADEEEQPVVAQGNSVDRFCEDLNSLTTQIASCTTEEDFEALEDLGTSLNHYRYDDTVLTTADKQAVTQSLVLFAGTVMQKAIDLSGEYISEDDQYQAGYAVGAQIKQIVDNSTTLADVCGGMENLD